MKVAKLIKLLEAMPQDYDVDVDRGGAYDSAKSVYVNEALESVTVSAEEDEKVDLEPSDF